MASERIPRPYDSSEKLADHIVHAIGIVLGLAGASAIVIMAANFARPTMALSIVVYASGLLCMLGLSAAYDAWPVSSVLRRLDHSAIYVMIGGTYTPFMVQLQSALASVAMLIGIWSAALAGILMKLLLPGRLHRMSVIVYVILGWSGATIFDKLLVSIPTPSLWLLAIGGIIYTAGVGFHLYQSLRFQNAIWHMFVLIGATCHYSAVLYCLAFCRA
jgi:hemolysin III